ncbi:unnamed protein product [marine sediment metagenome]|uniref:Cohesin domain-containing protein n=1 Tax=marine sediment metagenome TaxID=412755 RepID=X1DGY3_9ZZZZ
MKTKLREKKVRLFGKSIPLIAIVAVGLIVGIAGAAMVKTLDTSVTITEPIGGTVTVVLDVTHPGFTDTVTLEIPNDADREYGLNITPVVSYGGNESNVTITAGSADGDIIEAGATVMEYNITALGSGNITYTVETDAGAPTGELTIYFPIERLAPF